MRTAERTRAFPARLAAAIFAWTATAFADADTGIALNLRTAFPATGAATVCPDTPLRLTFATPPALGTRGNIRILDAAGNSVVETIDGSSPFGLKAIGGIPGYKCRPVIISGSEATIFPKNGHAIDAGRRLSASRQLQQPGDNSKIAAYRDPATVLGGNWNPKAAAIFKPAAGSRQ